MGGTGNQLFQYALGRSLEQNDAIQFATSHFTGDPARMYMLDQLGLDDLLVVPRGDERVIHEGPMPFKPEILEVKNCVLNGYWQTEKYFLRVQDRVRREIFSAPGFFMGEKTIAVADKIKRAPNSAFLHVRRSDNLSKRALMYHGMLDGVYYRDGVAYIRERAPNAAWTNKIWPYYVCHTKTCARYGKSIRRKDIEDKFIELLQKNTMLI